jgi:hypothetical protein
LSTTQIAVIFCETSNPTKQVINDPPMVRITGQRRPDRGTIGRSGANRDYRMSTYVSQALTPDSAIGALIERFTTMLAALPVLVDTFGAI